MKILIIGYGLTGIALKEYFDKYQNEVFIYDEKFVDDKNYYSYEDLISYMPIFDLGIKSPGIRNNDEKYEFIKSLCREVKSEIDYAYEHMDSAYIIGITGSNGKTTLATYLKHFLSLKKRVFLVGNIGKPLISVIDEVKKNDYVILELSSFQINDSKSIKLDELFITSISPNHLNNYLSVNHYYADKKRAFSFLKNNNYFALNNSHNFINIEQKEFEIKKDFTNNIRKYIEGNYFIEYANIAMNYCLNLSYKDVELFNLLKSLKVIKFRLNRVAKKDNLIFINDSKSTTSASSKYCYESFYDKKRILILGGIHKSDSFNKIKIYHNDEVLIYGSDKELIYSQIKGKIFSNLVEIFDYLKNKKEEAYILFSPGCDSHDEFKSYIDRGLYFNKLIDEVFYE